jgi:hypothetical protein
MVAARMDLPARQIRLVYSRKGREAVLMGAMIQPHRQAEIPTGDEKQ